MFSIADEGYCGIYPEVFFTITDLYTFKASIETNLMLDQWFLF